MAKSKHAVLAVLVVGIWVSKLSCSFVAPPRMSGVSTSIRAETHGYRTEASNSKPDAIFGSLTAAVVITGIASRAKMQKGNRIVGLRAEGETEAKEASDAQSEASDAKSEDVDEEVADGEEDDEDEEDEEDDDEEENKPSKWKCLDCGHVNFAQATECDKCGALKPSPEEAKLVEERDEAKDEVAKVMDGFLRMQADLQNYRRQHDEAMVRARDLGKTDALRKLLPFNEDIEAAIAETEGMDDKDKAIFDSYSLLFRKVGDVWAKNGIQSSTATVGEKFDTIEHIVVEEREATDGQEAGTILEVVKSGYKCDGKVVLPVEVVVVASEKEAEEDADGEDEASQAETEETEEAPEAASA